LQGKGKSTPGRFEPKPLLAFGAEEQEIKDVKLEFPLDKTRLQEIEGQAEVGIGGSQKNLRPASAADYTLKTHCVVL
jgi:hypothetical protein